MVDECANQNRRRSAGRKKYLEIVSQRRPEAFDRNVPVDIIQWRFRFESASAAPPAEVGYYRIRPPIKPITLGELAGQ